MKTNILKSGTLLLAFAALFAFQSCDKDDDTPLQPVGEQITGIWDVTSFKVGGSEYMNTVVETASFRYDTMAGASGYFRQTVKYADEDPEEVIEGTYKIEGGNQVVMTADGETKTLKAAVNGKRLQLEGADAGQSVVIKAEKRQ